MTYIKICPSQKELLSTILKYLKTFEDKKSTKVVTEFFRIEDKFIVIDNNEISRKTINTIKWIDDILDKYESIKNHYFFMAISEKKDDLIGVNNIDSFIIMKPKQKLIEIMEEWSLIKDVKKSGDKLFFNFNFYSALEYSKTALLHTKSGDAFITTAESKSHNLLFTIFRVGDIKKHMKVRVHHMCETSEIFDSIHCDCKEQLETFKEEIFKTGGLIIYCHEEGRGFGLKNKINAYWNTEHEGLDTIDAMIKETGKSENRLFEIPADIVHQLGVKSIDIWTNNPLKIDPFIDRGIKVKRKKHWPHIESSHAKNYVNTKVKRMKHYGNNN